MCDVLLEFYDSSARSEGGVRERTQRFMNCFLGVCTGIRILCAILVNDLLSTEIKFNGIY